MLTVAVVSWNTRELLLRCLRSLSVDAESGLVQVLVIDNGSVDGSAAAARTEAPWAEVIESGANLGYGRAVNRAARVSTAEWLLAANADVAFEPGALNALVDAARDPRTGCVAPRLILPGGGTQHSVHPFPTLPLTLAFNLGLHRLDARLAERLCLEGFWDPERERLVPWAHGACLLLRRAAFDAVGGFDERQWMYAEDLDLCWRLREAGWVTRFAPQARVLHAGSAATGFAFGDDKVARFMAATYVMLLRRRGAARMWATALANIGGSAARVAWESAALGRSAPERSARRSQGRIWLQAHVRGVRAAVGTGGR